MKRQRNLESVGRQLSPNAEENFANFVQAIRSFAAFHFDSVLIPLNTNQLDLLFYTTNKYYIFSAAAAAAAFFLSCCLQLLLVGARQKK
ncbi:hypothetical protein I308_103628 [Cryptococcus tetragattii IND107]|uniref:Transmembrane protein n=1 Tax=Cryptococcus tetragattii IND107 TaxID=1296105 RepID=A0ABR3BU54_9TREE